MVREPDYAILSLVIVIVVAAVAVFLILGTRVPAGNVRGLATSTAVPPDVTCEGTGAVPGLVGFVCCEGQLTTLPNCADSDAKPVICGKRIISCEGGRLVGRMGVVR